MNCPECHTKMFCVDSRDTETKTFGAARRRRYQCEVHGRFGSVEILLPEGTGTCETALRSLADHDFRASVRTAANHILNLVGGKT